MRLFGILLLAVWCVTGAASASEGTEEIVLVDKLDEPRGFCLDILGFKQRADPSRGLQAHSCYSYQGEIAVDQAFQRDRLSGGRLRMPAFDVCATLTDRRPGARLGLEKCDGRSEQQFEFTKAGTITVRSAPELCVTAGSGASRPGGGGNPVHLIRTLSIEHCDPARARYQQWRVRTAAD
jgi:hypothetical protein